MALYIVKMDNPKRIDDAGTPTRVRLIGPFDAALQASVWGHSDEHNPHDNPCWQVVDLETTTIEVVAP